MAVTQEYFAGNNSTHTIHFSQENFLSQMIPKVIVCESKMVARSQLQKESLSMLSEI
jgi:adenylosuccinate synthase